MSKFISDNERNLKLFERLNGRLPQNGEEFANFCEYVKNNSVSSRKEYGNIEQSFMEEHIRHIEEEEYRNLGEADFWDGDETDKIQY
jgi:hypothetical protein